ncbi:hypothetical protein CONPUDRAFT_78487, partial [Coniophora puteana RWD-64-598 SS2]
MSNSASTPQTLPGWATDTGFVWPTDAESAQRLLDQQEYRCHAMVEFRPNPQQNYLTATIMNNDLETFMPVLEYIFEQSVECGGPWDISLPPLLNALDDLAQPVDLRDLYHHKDAVLQTQRYQWVPKSGMSAPVPNPKGEWWEILRQPALDRARHHELFSSSSSSAASGSGASASVARSAGSSL